MECGTHAIVDADLDECRSSEHHGAHKLLRSVTAEMLVTLDSGYVSTALWYGIRQKGAHVLGRLTSSVLKRGGRVLSDGSVLTQLAPSRSGVYRCKEAVPVRVISYRVTDERVGDPKTIYRLATTLLDPQTAPADDLIALYHERWEVEIVIDELKNHQRLSERTLRSQTPEGVRKATLWLVPRSLRFAVLDAPIGQRSRSRPRSTQFYLGFTGSR